LFERDWFDCVVFDGGGKETDFEWFVTVSVFVLHTAEFDGFR